MSPGFKSILAGSLLLLLAGCAGVKPAPQPPWSIPPEAPISIPPETPPPEEPVPEPVPPTPEPPRKPPTPRSLASLELSKQAQILIESNRPDEAIRILEQAVNLHPRSGENYYYLAEAWRLKDNPSQASEYNTLASIRFKDDAEWMRRIELQRQRIERME